MADRGSRYGKGTTNAAPPPGPRPAPRRTGRTSVFDLLSSTVCHLSFDIRQPRPRRSKLTPHWRLRPHDPDRIAALSRGAAVHPLIAQILLNRGVSDPAGVRAFLDA